MATKKHKVTGTSMWAKVFEHNAELKDWQGNPHPFGKQFKIDVILDKENKAVYKASGTSGKGKFDDDGNFLATFKRKEKERFDWAGGPPKVINEDGTPFTGSIIPNGSIVEVEFTVYTTSMSPGTRLEQVRILELVKLEEKEEAKPSIESSKTTVNTDIPF
ncbi:hypothetical protein EKK58_08290 [Candidatus Dependentiae bacterium]|nr:MAG: hypothetical protein EKK58_08290 [Candidatus Dependentiae bacterium]